MNFVADEGVDRAVIERLRTDGRDVVYIAELSSGISDDQVLSIANEANRVLITSDRDFGELVFRQNRIHTGVVLLRLAGLSNELKKEIVSSSLQAHGPQLTNCFTVILPGRLRIRRKFESI